MYSNDMTWNNWKNCAGVLGMQLTDLITLCKHQHEKFYALTYGKTPAQIAAMSQFSGTTEADITALQYAMGVFEAMDTALTPTMRGYLTPFEWGTF